MGGLPEVVKHGIDGYLAPVGDVTAAARYAIALLSAPERAREMGHQARESARARYCSTKIIPLYEAYYRSVLERSS